MSEYYIIKNRGDDMWEIETDFSDNIFYFDDDFIETHSDEEIWDACHSTNTYNTMVNNRIESGLYDEWEGF